jgi:prepilin-type processing-associated H-X9-DG protein
LTEIRNQRLDLYQCPTDDPNEMTDRFFPGSAVSSYASVNGSYSARQVPEDLICNPATNAECKGAGPQYGVLNIDGIMYPGSETEIAQITDGTSNTLLMGEYWYQFRAWPNGSLTTPNALKPHPPTGFTPSNTLGLSSKNINHRYPLNANLEVVGYYVSHQNELDRPTKVTSTSGTMGLNNVPFASFHTAGVNFAMGDGSVRFVDESTDMEIMKALASRNGDETNAKLP